MKVLMICDFSVDEIRQHLDIDNNSIGIRILSMLNKPTKVVDHGLWNYYAIKELQNHLEVELSVVSFHDFLRNKIQEFEMHGVKYFFIRSYNSKVQNRIGQKIIGKRIFLEKGFDVIEDIIKRVNPDLVHVIGAETPSYSEAILRVPQNIPTIVQLQTLVADPEIAVHYPELTVLRPTEFKTIQRADYIGTSMLRYGRLLKELIKKDAVILNTVLAIAEPIDESESEKCFDFVYFSANINKACDLAVEAFAIAKTKHPEITLDVVGLYDNAFKKKIDSRLAELHIEDSVTFEGRLVSHEAVMSQIKKARFALVPVKTDLICSTMREAMAKGLPLVTTITPDTPSLNKDRESVLLSPIGDAEAMANNMNKLIEDPAFAIQLRDNALQSYRERYSNWAEIQKWVECYKLCVENHKNGTPIPYEYILNC